MLPFQVGAIEPNRSGTRDVTWSSRAVRLNCSCARWALSILLLSILLAPSFGKTKGGHKKQNRAATEARQSPSPAEGSLTNIPLATGHEAKGLILPDYDSQGRLRGKFIAGAARRIDEDHIGFRDLKITTYTPEEQPDLQIDLRTSVLDLKTRVLTSPERTVVRRADFNIVGDSVRFDTVARTGRLIGNVKMVLTDKSRLLGKEQQ